MDPSVESGSNPVASIRVESVTSDDFESGTLKPEEGFEDTPAQEPWASDFSEQVMKYRQNKPTKTKDVTSRECSI